MVPDGKNVFDQKKKKKKGIDISIINLKERKWFKMRSQEPYRMKRILSIVQNNCKVPRNILGLIAFSISLMNSVQVGKCL